MRRTPQQRSPLPRLLLRCQRSPVSRRANIATEAVTQNSCFEPLRYYGVTHYTLRGKVVCQPFPLDPLFGSPQDYRRQRILAAFVSVCECRLPFFAACPHSSRGQDCRAFLFFTRHSRSSVSAANNDAILAYCSSLLLV